MQLTPVVVDWRSSCMSNDVNIYVSVRWGFNTCYYYLLRNSCIFVWSALINSKTTPSLIISTDSLFACWKCLAASAFFQTIKPETLLVLSLSLYLNMGTANAYISSVFLCSTSALLYCNIFWLLGFVIWQWWRVVRWWCWKWRF